MSFRRNKKQMEQSKKWQSFCVAHQELIQQIGLAPELYETAEEFAVFLEHGHNHHNDPVSFTVTELDPGQYQALYKFIDRYFEAGYFGGSVSSFVALKNTMSKNWQRNILHN